VEIFSGLSGRGPVQRELTDTAFLQAMLDAEVALAQALVSAGFADARAADEIAAACADADTFDIAGIGRSTGDYGTPVPGMLAAIRDRIGPEAADAVHRGATSQDIVDTAMALVASRALRPLHGELAAAQELCARLAGTHRTTVMAGRTLLQQAQPITFGLKAAGWLDGLTAARRELSAAAAGAAVVQLGGAVGTLADYGPRGPEVLAAFAAGLGLGDPGLPWHTVRVRPAALGAALGTAAGVMAKIARDLVLLAQTEVGEAAERPSGGRGGSSAMAHKHNPVGAIAVLACAGRTPGLVATLLSTMAQEHERAAGAWQAEWEPLIELLRLTGSAATALREALGMLELDADRMIANLAPLRKVLAEPPADQLGATDALIDRAVAAYEADRSSTTERENRD
jgi:3-carboxy-cis,cis-muconate cycloisomerase